MLELLLEVLVGGYLLAIVASAIHHCLTFDKKRDWGTGSELRSWNLW